MVSGLERLERSSGLLSASEHISKLSKLKNDKELASPVRAWFPSRGVPASMAWRREGLLNMRPIYRVREAINRGRLLMKHKPWRRVCLCAYHCQHSPVWYKSIEAGVILLGLFLGSCMNQVTHSYQQFLHNRLTCYPGNLLSVEHSTATGHLILGQRVVQLEYSSIEDQGWNVKTSEVILELKLTEYIAYGPTTSQTRTTYLVHPGECLSH